MNSVLLERAASAIADRTRYDTRGVQVIDLGALYDEVGASSDPERARARREVVGALLDAIPEAVARVTVAADSITVTGWRARWLGRPRSGGP